MLEIFFWIFVYFLLHFREKVKKYSRVSARILSLEVKAGDREHVWETSKVVKLQVFFLVFAFTARCQEKFKKIYLDFFES